MKYCQDGKITETDGERADIGGERADIGGERINEIWRDWLKRKSL